jgi:hypothetical protein
MCYLCLKNDLFNSLPPSKTERNKQRALEIKNLLKDAETSSNLCESANQEVEKLKEEQYKLAREL